MVTGGAEPYRYDNGCPCPNTVEARMHLGSLIPWRDTNQVDADPDSYSDPFVSFRREVDRMFGDFFAATNRRGLQPWNAG